MRQREVSEGGMILAVFLSLVGTVGTMLCRYRMIDRFDWLWIGVFVLSLLTLSGAVVNFDPKRLIK